MKLGGGAIANSCFLGFSRVNGTGRNRTFALSRPPWAQGCSQGLCFSLLWFAQDLVDWSASNYWAGTVRQKKKRRWGRKDQFQGRAATPDPCGAQPWQSPLITGRASWVPSHLWAKACTSAFCDHLLSKDLSKAEWAQQLPLGKGTLGYWQELWFATPTLRQLCHLGGGGPGHQALAGGHLL